MCTLVAVTMDFQFSADASHGITSRFADNPRVAPRSPFLDNFRVATIHAESPGVFDWSHTFSFLSQSCKFQKTECHIERAQHEHAWNKHRHGAGEQCVSLEGGM